ncbi:chemotaxis protein MotB [Serinibacter arcticus]|uniref:Chemotaxis protein MotB n=2 Tax=Serinibacter arcticus TaxID=1655435 RepID=A0A2U1ZW65_9MICO|nr:chemotaxis protein MotB [Serinibacter arcticus]
MTALLIVFILAVIVLVLQLTRAEEALVAEQERAAQQQLALSEQIGALSATEDVRSAVVVEIADDLQSQGIPVSVSDNNAVLSIPTEVLGFDDGAHEIKPEFQPTALAIGRTIASSLASGDRFRSLDTVFVEGHTDNRAFGGLDGTGNWGLSAFRAISLWQLWRLDPGPTSQLSVMQRADGSPLFSVSGYGETRPATAAQNTPEEQAANRRIEIRFTVQQPSADDLARVAGAEEDG